MCQNCCQCSNCPNMGNGDNNNGGFVANIIPVNLANNHKRNVVNFPCLALECCYCPNATTSPTVDANAEILSTVANEGYTYIMVRVFGSVKVSITPCQTCDTPFCKVFEVVFHKESENAPEVELDGGALITPVISCGCNEVCTISLDIPVNVTLED